MSCGVAKKKIRNVFSTAYGTIYASKISSESNLISCNNVQSHIFGCIEIYIHRHMSIMKQFELRIQIYHSKCSFWNIFISQILNSLQASNVYCIPRYLITILEGDNLSFFAQSILKICKSFETKFCMSWVYYSPVRYMEEV